MIAPIAAVAQDKDLFRAQSKTAAAELRAAGEPKDRCWLGAFVSGPGIISRTAGTNVLAPGDKLLAIDGKEVAGKEADHVIAILRATAPTATVAVSVERAGKIVPLELTCLNSRPSMEVLLTALDQSAAGKFEECATTLQRRTDLGTHGAVLSAQCAITAKKPKQHAIPQLTYDAAKMLVEDAHWVPSVRGEVVERLRALEGTITQQMGKSRFDELVSLTRAWPGGQDAFAASTPDWTLFRRNSERALSAKLVDPDSARIEFPRGFMYGTWKPLLAKRVEGYWTCGLINARNRMGGYTGATSFVVVLDRSGSVLFSDMGTGRDFDILTSQCTNSASMLPPAPAEFAEAPGGGQTPAASLADELKKLVDLKNSGALTDAEFQAAKAKLLGDGNQ